MNRFLVKVLGLITAVLSATLTLFVTRRAKEQKERAEERAADMYKAVKARDKYTEDLRKRLYDELENKESTDRDYFSK